MNAVVILNYNDSLQTIHMTSQYRKRNDIQYIVIVDNKSTDDSFEKLRKLRNERIFVIKADNNNGYAAGNNLGIRFIEKNLSDVEYILISNPDIELTEFDMDACVSHLKNDSRLALISPRIKTLDGRVLRGWNCPTYSTMMYELLIRPIFKKMYRTRDVLDKTIDVICYQECLSGCFFVTSLSTMREIGYFDENTFLYGEESILGFKIKKNNMYCGILMSQEVVHLESISINKSIKSKKNKLDILKNSRLYYMEKYMHCSYIQCKLYEILYVIKMYISIVILRLNRE